LDADIASHFFLVLFILEVLVAQLPRVQRNLISELLVPPAKQSLSSIGVRLHDESRRNVNKAGAMATYLFVLRGKSRKIYGYEGLLSAKGTDFG
jgi:hypothetical protein